MPDCLSLLPFYLELILVSMSELPSELITGKVGITETLA